MTAEPMSLHPADLLAMSSDALDELYNTSPIGNIPNGNTRGTAIIAAGTVLAKILAPLIRAIAWQGKVFHRQEGYLLNKISPFRFRAVKAEVYRGESWLTEGETTVLDYSKTSFVAQKIRDEIREVSPGLYLGPAYWGNRKLLYFVLEV